MTIAAVRPLDTKATELGAASRFANPFASCWTRPGALDWLADTESPDVDLVLDRFFEHRRGQIVGRHGVGKSALVAAIVEALRRRGEAVERRVLHDGRLVQPLPRSASGAILVVDGFEQLGPIQQLAVAAPGRRLLVTTHRRHRWLALPLLATLQPSLATVTRLFGQLTRDRPTHVTEEDVRRSYHRFSGNVRDTWFDLYDRHERLAAAARTNS